MIVFLDWWNQIDWSATGSMLSGIGTCIAAGLALFIAIKQGKLTKDIAYKQNELTKQIADKQIKQTELDQKIALYDKRYEIFQLFSQYIYVGNILSERKKELTPQMDATFIEQIYYDNKADRKSITEKLTELSKTVDDPQLQALVEMQKMTGIYSIKIENYNKSRIQLDKLYNQLRNLDYNFAEQQIRKIKMAEFCFPENIAKPIVTYISLIFSNEAYEKKKFDNDKIIKVFTEIKENKIFDKMKNLLKLSYDDVSRQG